MAVVAVAISNARSIIAVAAASFLLGCPVDVCRDRHTRIQTYAAKAVPRAHARFRRTPSGLGCVVSLAPVLSVVHRLALRRANSSRRRATGSLGHRNPRSDLPKPVRKLRVSNCARRARTALCTQHQKKVWRRTSSTSPCRMTTTINRANRSSRRSARRQIFYN